MRVADYIFEFIAKQGVEHIFFYLAVARCI